MGLVGPRPGCCSRFVTSGTPYVVLIIPMIIMSAGMALSTPPLTGSIMSAVPLGKAGVGSAMNDTTRELGGALGVAVLGSIVASRYDAADRQRHHRPAGSRPRRRADASLSGALEVARRSAATSGARIADAAQDAYVSGMSIATLVGAVVAAIGVGHRLPQAPVAVRTRLRPAAGRGRRPAGATPASLEAD